MKVEITTKTGKIHKVFKVTDDSEDIIDTLSYSCAILKIHGVTTEGIGCIPRGITLCIKVTDIESLIIEN